MHGMRRWLAILCCLAALPAWGQSPSGPANMQVAPGASNFVGTLGIANGGTGATTAAGALSALGAMALNPTGLGVGVAAPANGITVNASLVGAALNLNNFNTADGYSGLELRGNNKGWLLSKRLNSDGDTLSIFSWDGAAYASHSVLTPGGGWQFGVPTGGDKGSGTLNLTGGLYDNGTAPTGTAGSGYTRATSAALTTPAIAGGTATGLTGLAIRDTSAAFDVTIAGTSSTTLNAGRTLTLDMKNVAHTLAFNATANTITFPNTASYTLIGSLDTGTVTNTMLAGSIAASKLVGTDITTVGALAAGSIASGFGTISTANTITTTVLMSGGGLTVTSSSTPTNGVYLPAASTVGLVGASKLEFFAGAVNELDFAVTTAAIWTSTPGWTFTNAAIKMTGITTGTNADTVCLKADGTLLIQAAACTISSMRFKRDIESIPASDSLATVMALQPKQFYMKDENQNIDKNAARVQLGLIAEDVAALDPRLAIYEPDMETPKSWRLEGMIAVMAGAIQEQQREIEALKRQLRQ